MTPPSTWPRRCAARPPRTASTRRRPGRPTRTGRTGTRSTWWTSGTRGRPAHERLRLRRDRRRRRVAGPGTVEVNGVRHTAEHVVLATGSDPVVPAVPGLRELEGIWTNREVTGMKAVPRRLLILGGGPVGAEMAQAVRRLGGEVVMVEGAGHVLAREPAPLGEALGEVLRAEGVDLLLGVRATSARRDGPDYVLVLDDGTEL